MNKRIETILKLIVIIICGWLGLSFPQRFNEVVIMLVGVAFGYTLVDGLCRGMEKVKYGKD